MNITIDREIVATRERLTQLEKTKLAAEQLEAQKQQVLAKVDQQAQRQAELNASLNTAIEETKPKVAEERELASLISKLSAQAQELQKIIAQKQTELHNLRNNIQVSLAAALYPIVQNELQRRTQNDMLGDVSHAHNVQHEVSSRVRKVLAQISETYAQVEL